MPGAIGVMEIALLTMLAADIISSLMVMSAQLQEPLRVLTTLIRKLNYTDLISVSLTSS